MAEILFEEENYKIVGSFFEVYNEPGCGFLEAVHRDPLRFGALARGFQWLDSAM